MQSPRVIDSLTEAFDVMIDMLFKPFDMGKWCVLGLVFFLAGLTQDLSQLMQIPFQFAEVLAVPVAEDPESFVVPAVIGGIVFFVVMIVAAVISSIGKFVIYENIQNEEPGVSGRWGKHTSKGISFFLLKLGIGVIMVIFVTLLLLIGAMAMGVSFSDPSSFSETMFQERIGLFFLLILVFGLVFVGLSIFLGMILTFVPIIMYIRNCGAGAALSEFMGLFLAKPGSFMLYILMSWLVAMGASIVVQIGVLVTCCLGALPYVRSTLFLPVLMTLELYPVSFIGQILPEYDIILTRFRGNVISEAHPDSFSGENGSDYEESSTDNPDDQGYRKSWDD
jgi:hypothetical protein